MGEVKSSNDGFILNFVVGGLESEFEYILHIDPIRGGQNQAYSTSVGIGGPIHGQPPYGEVGCELGGFSRVCRGEFHDEICQNLPFDCCSWLVSNVELTQLYAPFHQSSRGFWFMQYLLHRVFCWNFDIVGLEVWPKSFSGGHQCKNELFHLRIPFLFSSHSSATVIDKLLHSVPFPDHGGTSREIENG